MKNSPSFRRIYKLSLYAFIFSNVYYPFELYFKGNSGWQLISIPMIVGTALLFGIITAIFYIFCKDYPNSNGQPALYISKVRPANYRYCFSLLLSLPIAIAIFFTTMHWFDKRSMFIFWLALIGYGLIALLFSLLWAKYVPAKVSLILALITWPIMYWVFLYKFF